MSDDGVTDLESFRRGRGGKGRGNGHDGGGGGGGGKGGDGSGGGDQAPTQREKLLLVAQAARLWRDQDHNAYATVEVDGHEEHYAVRSSGFRRWWIARYGEAWPIAVGGQEVPGAPSTSALEEARNALDARAASAPVHAPCVRVGGDCTRVYLDLGRDDWTMIEVDEEGWRPVRRTPVKMVRPNGMRPLAAPEPGGGVDELRDLLNFGGEAGETAFRLFVGWLLAALHPECAYPILFISGEHGSGKSTVAEAAKRLIDPHRAMRRSLPKDPSDLFVAATSSRALLFDNVSSVDAWLADELAKLSTGGALGKRALYTDSEETYLTARNPLILNGIPDLGTRADLADRGIVLKLATMPDGARRPDRELWAALDDAAPRVLGALLDGVASAIRDLPEVEDLARGRDDKPRLLDASLWIEAAAPAFGWTRWDWLDLYAGNRREVVEVALEADAVAKAVREMAEGDRGETYEGTATALLERLTARVDEKVSKAKSWPVDATRLGARLRRAAPGLRKMGIDVEETRSKDKLRQRVWSIRRAARPEQ